MDSTVPDITGAATDAADFFIGVGSDFFAFIVVAALVAAYAFYFGRDRLIPLIGGLFAAIPLYTYFPFFDAIGSNPYLHFGVFFIFIAIGTIAFLGLASWIPSSGTGFIKVLGLSVVTAGMFLAVGLHLLPLAEIYAISEPTRALFADGYLFYWLLAGVGGVFFLGR